MRARSPSRMPRHQPMPRGRRMQRPKPVMLRRRSPTRRRLPTPRPRSHWTRERSRRFWLEPAGRRRGVRVPDARHPGLRRARGSRRDVPLDGRCVRGRRGGGGLRRDGHGARQGPAAADDSGGVAHRNSPRPGRLHLHRPRRAARRARDRWRALRRLLDSSTSGGTCAAVPVGGGTVSPGFTFAGSGPFAGLRAGRVRARLPGRDAGRGADPRRRRQGHRQPVVSR